MDTSREIDTKVKPISIFDEDFEKGVTERKRTKTKAAEVEHAIRHHLDVKLDDDPDLQASFAEVLAAILEQFRDNWDKIYEELENCASVSRRPATSRPMDSTARSRCRSFACSGGNWKRP